MLFDWHKKLRDKFDANQENENNELDAFVKALKDFESITTENLKNFILENLTD